MDFSDEEHPEISNNADNAIRILFMICFYSINPAAKL